MNTECCTCISEVMATATVLGGVHTDLICVKELLDEMNKLHDIDLLPLPKCILGVHLLAEFEEKAMLQDERELS